MGPEAFIISPAEAEAERREAASAARKTPASCGNAPGTNRARRPKRKPGVRYSVDAYRRAIARACDRAFPAPAPFGRLEGETKQSVARTANARSAQRLTGVAEFSPIVPASASALGCHTIAAYPRTRSGTNSFGVPHNSVYATICAAERGGRRSSNGRGRLRLRSRGRTVASALKTRVRPKKSPGPGRF